MSSRCGLINKGGYDPFIALSETDDALWMIEGEGGERRCLSQFDAGDEKNFDSQSST
jgi:hypothetical protein